MKPKNNRGFIKTLVDPKPLNHLKRWALDDVITLLEGFKNEISFVDLAVTLNRSVVSCISKLRDLYFIHYNQRTDEYQWSANGHLRKYRYKEFMTWQQEVNRVMKEKQENSVTASQ